MIDTSKVYKSYREGFEDYNLKLWVDKYCVGDGLYIGITDEYGEPFSDFTVNLPGFTDANLIAVDDFIWGFDRQLVQDILKDLNAFSVGTYPSGFVDYNCFLINEEM